MIFYGKFNANQRAAKNSNNAKAFIFHNTPKCIKLKCNTVNKNNNFSNDHCNTNKNRNSPPKHMWYIEKKNW